MLSAKVTYTNRQSEKLTDKGTDNQTNGRGEPNLRWPSEDATVDVDFLGRKHVDVDQIAQPGGGRREGERG